MPVGLLDMCMVILLDCTESTLGSFCRLPFISSALTLSEPDTKAGWSLYILFSC